MSTSQKTSRVAVITGASSGIGEAAARAVRWVKRGARINTISPGTSLHRWPRTSSPGRVARGTGE
jgi:hypothetical protein